MDPAGSRASGGGRGKDGGKTQARRSPAQQTQTERTGPRQYLSEVRAEMRKVAWPTRAEIINSSIIVLIAVTVMTLLIFGFDYLSAKFVLFLYD
jgi:preprotein translocase subunit SecE